MIENIDIKRLVILCPLAFLLGIFWKTIINKLKHIYLHLKLGICFRYKGTGIRETRNGTNSEFCIRCGHPYGYH
jgi:hypothetical protein